VRDFGLAEFSRSEFDADNCLGGTGPFWPTWSERALLARYEMPSPDWFFRYTPVASPGRSREVPCCER